MTANKSFYNFEKIEERWQKKFKKNIAHNVFALGAVAEFGAKNFQPTTKADARHTLELTTKTAIEPNAC